MKSAVFASLAVLLALQTSGTAASRTQTYGNIIIRTLSTRPDRVSGGDVLVFVAPPLHGVGLHATLNGRDVTKVFRTDYDDARGVFMSGPTPEFITEPQTFSSKPDSMCNASYPSASFTRQVAGGPLDANVLKCQLKPIDAKTIQPRSRPRISSACARFFRPVSATGRSRA